MSASVVHHPIFARFFDRLSRLMEREAGRHRDELLAGLAGRVVEVGAGNGINFAHYPDSVNEVIALEPEAYLRQKAQRAARDAPVPVSVRAGVAAALPLNDASIDGAVASLVLCTVPDLPAALAELRRVLKPGGELRFMEHVRSPHPGKARLQQGLDRSGIWARLGGGCHCGRDTVTAIQSSGFQLNTVRRYALGPSWIVTNPHVLGSARAPEPQPLSDPGFTAAMTAAQDHWQGVYDRREPREMSWYEPAAEISLALIQEAQLPADAAIIDAGGGTSELAGQLLEGGYTDITVADISPQALQRARLELTDSVRIHWVQADLRSHNFDRRYDLWHDRAVFHFMVDPTDREHYLATLRTSLLPGGHLILATFGPDGPTRCSGLRVTRYSTDQLAALLPDFKLLSTRQTEHATPSGATQQFIHVHLRRYASAPRSMISRTSEGPKNAARARARHYHLPASQAKAPAPPWACGWSEIGLGGGADSWPAA